MDANLIGRLRNRIWRAFGRLNASGPPLFSKLPEALAAYDAIPGFLSPREAAALYYYAARAKRAGVIVEVGSWKGKSTYCLAKGLRHGKVFAIDPFDASGDPSAVEIYQAQKGEMNLLRQFKERMAELGVEETIRILHGRSVDFKDEFETVDLLFIDGDHSISGCKTDFDLFAHKVVPGGYILFHDYDPKCEELGPTWVIDNFVAKNSVFKFICLVDSLWIGRRRGSLDRHE